MNSKTLKIFIISTFISLYVLTSSISCIHTVYFFKLSNPDWLAITLALAFEIGAAASLASIIALDRMNKTIIWALFIVLTLMQAMGNSFHSYTHLHDYKPWVELFGLTDEDPIFQKRILSIVSGAILPLIALGFIKALIDYIKPVDKPQAEISNVTETKVPITVLEEATDVINTTVSEVVDTPPLIEPEIINNTIEEVIETPQIDLPAEIADEKKKSGQ